MEGLHGLSRSMAGDESRPVGRAREGHADRAKPRQQARWDAAPRVGDAPLVTVVGAR